MTYPRRTENILFKSIKIVIYLIPCLPLYVSSSTLFPYITGKNFAFRILVELIAVLWLGLIAINRENRPRNSLILTAILLFTFIVGLADLFGMNAYKSFWSNYERMEGYITILHLVLYYIVIKSIFRTERDWKIFFSISVIVSTTVSLFIFVEPLVYTHSSVYLAEYGTRRASTIGNAPFLAAYLLFSAFIGLLLMLMTQKKYLKLLFLFTVFINLIVIYVTASRGAIIAAVAGAVIMSMSLIFNKLKRPVKINFKKAVPPVLGLLILLSVVLLAYNHSELLKKDLTYSRFMSIFSDDPSVRTRIYTWKMAWNGIKEKPLLGWGQENFVGVYNVNPISPGDTLLWVDRAHNIILDWLVNAGIFGLFSYLSIYIIAFSVLWSNFNKKITSRQETIVVITALFVYFIQNLITFDSINTYLLFFSLLAYIDSIDSMKSNIRVNILDASPSDRNKKLIGLSSVALIVFVFIFYFINYNPIKQLRLYSKISMSLSQYTKFSKMLNDFNHALSYSSFGDNDIRNQMADVSYQLLKYKLYKQEGASKLIQTTAQEMEKGILSEHDNLEYLYNALGFYELLASYDPSFITFVEKLIVLGLKLNPEFSRMDAHKIELYFLKKEYELAYIKLKDIVDQYPNNAGVQYKLALAAIMTHRADDAESALEKFKNIMSAYSNDISLGVRPVFYINQLKKIAQTHLEAKNYKQAQKYYNEILFNLSKYKEIRLGKGYIEPLTDEDKIKMKVKIHLEIAKIYISLNDRENARIEADKAAELDPEFFKSIANNSIHLLFK